MRYLDREAQAYYRQGYEFGDNDALQTAIARRRNLIELNPRARLPLAWANLQDKLGSEPETLGQRERGTARLEAAVVAYRAALEERTRARAPLDWANTQMGLGNALALIGEREGGTVRLEEAVLAYRAALEENTRARAPLQWAATQTNLGTRSRYSASVEAGRHGWRRQLLRTGRRWKSALARATPCNGP